MLQLLTLDNAWIKLSGIANLSDQTPDFANVRAIHELLVDARPDRLVWGSDWPHTRPSGYKPDSRHLLGLFHTWTPKAMRSKILSINPAKLYGFSAP